jgi:hypothetical protein
MIARALKGKLVVFAVFFIGIITGMLIINFYETRVAGSPPDLSDQRGRISERDRDVNRVHDYLALDEQQRERVNEILEEGRRQVRELRAETRPKVQAIEENTQSQIRAVLNPDQVERYEKFRRDVQERRSQARRSKRGN